MKPTPCSVTPCLDCLLSCTAVCRVTTPDRHAPRAWLADFIADFIGRPSLFPFGTGSPLRLRASPYGSSPVSPGRFHINRDVLDEPATLHNLDRSDSRSSLHDRVLRTAQGRMPVSELNRTTYPRPAHHSINPLACEPSRHDVDPYRVNGYSVAGKAPDFWERKRPTTSGVGTMRPQRQLTFPTAFERPRELNPEPRKDCMRQGLDPYGAKKKNLWVTDKKLMSFRLERWRGKKGSFESTRQPW